MSDLSPLNVRGILRRHGLRPKKGLGQNFLVDSAGLEKVVAAADIEPSDVVLEVGPGLGGLTRQLAQRARRVVAVELDLRLFPPLQETLAPFSNVELVQGDILEQAPGELVGEHGYLVVANIPYYITSALLRHLLEAEIRPRRLVLTVQREVAERICAGPGEMSLLALSVQIHGQPRVMARLPAGMFYPRPKVDSSVVRVDLHPTASLPADELAAFFRLARAGFGQRRKTLRNSLSAGLGLPRARVEELLQGAEIDPQRRAETLGLEEWQALAHRLVQMD